MIRTGNYIKANTPQFFGKRLLRGVLFRRATSDSRSKEAKVHTDTSLCVFSILSPPLNEKLADGPYQDEYQGLCSLGMDCSRFDFDAIAFDEFAPSPHIQPGEAILYRGWMLNPKGYQTLTQYIRDCGGRPITTMEHYSQCHHFKNWYTTCQDLTAETHFFDVSDDIVAAAQQLGWGRFFVKDFVKSNTGDKGSIARSPQEIQAIVAQLTEYRGEIEGGIALRRVESFVPDSEQRYFVVNGKAWGMAGEIPQLVSAIASRIQAPFYSVDVAMTTRGDLQLVELGDGQVSDKKDWPLEAFLKVLTSIAPQN